MNYIPVFLKKKPIVSLKNVISNVLLAVKVSFLTLMKYERYNLQIKKNLLFNPLNAELNPTRHLLTPGGSPPFCRRQQRKG
jgi:hypothetical protein